MKIILVFFLWFMFVIGILAAAYCALWALYLVYEKKMQDVQNNRKDAVHRD